ncbi:MAG: UDP-N-acetylmuramate dehydrogenase [Minisyncoccia bacterium]
MLKIFSNVDLSQLSFFRIGGIGQFFATINSLEDLIMAVNFSKKNHIPLYVIGSGSNTIFSDKFIKKFFIKLNIKSKQILSETKNTVNVLVEAGHNWDDFVLWAVNNSLAGVEALSGIPGTVGAAPIQNIGAYGQELNDTIKNVFAYDLKNNNIVKLTKAQCGFGYRTSIFKTAEKGRHIILSISLSLVKNKYPQIPEYKDVIQYFQQKKLSKPSILDIRNAVLKIRKNKLPNPKKFPNVGSFFENPIISKNQFKQLQQKYPDLVAFMIDQNYYKISAGWLIEKCGLKGKTINNIKIFDKNALVLINNKANFKNLMQTIRYIKKKVRQNFNIQLVEEPNII